MHCRLPLPGAGLPGAACRRLSRRCSPYAAEMLAPCRPPRSLLPAKCKANLLQPHSCRSLVVRTRPRLHPAPLPPVPPRRPPPCPSPPHLQAPLRPALVPLPPPPPLLSPSPALPRASKCVQLTTEEGLSLGPRPPHRPTLLAPPQPQERHLAPSLFTVVVSAPPPLPLSCCPDDMLRAPSAARGAPARAICLISRRTRTSEILCQPTLNCPRFVSCLPALVGSAIS